MERIAVIGATGMLGVPVTAELSKAGYHVRAIVRNVNKAEKLLPGNVERVEGDLRDVSSLIDGFKGMEAIYLSLSTAPGERNNIFRTEIEGVENVLEAARLEGVRRVAYLSSLVQTFEEYDWWVFDLKQTAVRTLKASKIPATIFYPSNFMENLPNLHLSGNRLIMLGHQKTRSWYISASDYGKQVAESFKTESNGNMEYIVQGLEPYNFREAAEVFAKHYPNKELKVTTLPISLVKFFGLFSKKADFTAKITEAINLYDEQFDATRTWEELGKPDITLADFARSL